MKKNKSYYHNKTSTSLYKKSEIKFIENEEQKEENEENDSQILPEANEVDEIINEI